MRYKALELVMLVCVAGAQFASAQTQAPAVSEPAVSPVAHAAQDTTTENSLDMNASPEPAAAAPVTVETQITAEHQNKTNKKDAASNLQPDDPGKNPYWEPKDWTYIYNQGP